MTVFKLPLYHFFVIRVLHKKLSNRLLGVSQGFISAISELGSAFLFFVFVVPKLTLVQLVGFGAAAGAVEAIMFPFMQNPLKGTPLEAHLSEVIQRSSTNNLIQWMSVLERLFALFLHIGTRGLVYISLISGNIVPAILAVIAFATIDGRVYFAHLEKWSFDNLQVLSKIYTFIALVAISQALLFAFCFYKLM